MEVSGVGGWIGLSKGDRLSVKIHLRVAGRLIDDPVGRVGIIGHWHLVNSLVGGDGVIGLGDDIRRVGWVHWMVVSDERTDGEDHLGVQ